jgi:hypothetical protein
MTVSSSTSRNEYNGNGVTTSFAYTFRILDEDHVAVYVGGTLKAITTDYTVTGVGVSGGGNIVFGAAPSAGTGNVVIVRAVPLTQETDYVENDPFPAESHEDALDKLTMIVQQQQEILDRSLTLDVTDTATDTTLPTPEASKLLGWNSSADGLTNYASSSISATIVPTAFMETLLDDANAATARSTLGAEATQTAASKAEMEAGTEAALRSMSPLRVAQAIAALAGVALTRTTFTASGNLTFPSGVTQAWVTGQAAGGGGGGSTDGADGGDLTFGPNGGAVVLTLGGGKKGTAYSSGTPGTGGAGGGTGLNQGSYGENGQDKTDIGGGVNPASYSNALGGHGGNGMFGNLGSGGRGSDGTGLSGAAAGGGGAGEQCFSFPVTVTAAQWDVTIGAVGAAGTASGAGTASSAGKGGFFIVEYLS